MNEHAAKQERQKEEEGRSALHGARAYREKRRGQGAGGGLNPGVGGFKGGQAHLQQSGEHEGATGGGIGTEERQTEEERRSASRGYTVGK